MTVGGLQRRLGYASCACSASSGRRMALDQVEFLGGEFARLVENLGIDAHLADVMQQSGHAQQLQLVIRQAEVIAESHRHDRNGQAVQAGIQVLALQPDQPEHRAFIAQHARRTLDHAMAGPRVDHSAMLHVGENLFDQLGAVPISRASLFYLAGQWLLRPLRGLAFARRHGGGCTVL